MIPHDFKNLKIRQPRTDGWQETLAAIGFILTILGIILLGILL
jgi:hypothetical protein